jgi:predicted dehydrogenase
MLGVGIIGYGYWGPNLVRNFMETPGATVIAVSDLRPERLALVQQRYPSVRTTTDHKSLIDDPAVDAVAIATPVSTHFALAMQALRAGKHILVEKPMTTTAEQGVRLLEEAERLKKVLLVDHTFVYMGAVRKIKELVTSQALGEIYYYDSIRVNLGLFQHDVNVLWDLAVHDLSIMDYVLGETPVAVTASGISHVSGRPPNIAYATLFFDSSLIAHVNVNWLSPVKLRHTLIGGSQKMLLFDDLASSEKIKLYDKGITVTSDPDAKYASLIGYRTGDMWAPQFDLTEALKIEAKHFLQCIDGGECPVTDGQMGLRVVRILEAATESLHDRGRLVELK